jgi:hypothetical protein
MIDIVLKYDTPSEPMSNDAPRVPEDYGASKRSAAQYVSRKEPRDEESQETKSLSES